MTAPAGFGSELNSLYLQSLTLLSDKKRSVKFKDKTCVSSQLICCQATLDGFSVIPGDKNNWPL